LAAYKGASKIVLLLDNVAYHHAKKIVKWLERHPVSELFFLPPCSPDLNAIERDGGIRGKK
jgi:transposase